MHPRTRSGRRQVFLTVTLAVVLVLAGCQTGPGNGTPSPATEAGPSATPTPGTSTTPIPESTATPTAVGTATLTGTPTPEPAERTGSALADSHEENLRAAGSFRVDYVATLETNGTALEREMRIDVDFEERRGVGTNNLTGYEPDGSVNSTLALQKYIEAETTYRRLQVGHDDPTVITGSESGTELNETNVVPGDGHTAMLGGEVARWVEGHVWIPSGTVTRDGVEMVRFELASDTYSDASLAPFDVNGTLSGARVQNATMLVSGGIVRSLSLELESTAEDGETVRVVVEFRVEDVGSGGVEEPGWVAEARDD